MKPPPARAARQELLRLAVRASAAGDHAEARALFARVGVAYVRAWEVAQPEGN